MRISRRFSSLLSAISLVAGLAAPAFADSVTLPDGDWIRLEFGSLTVVGNVKEKRAADYARQLLVLDSLLERFKAVETANPREKVLYLFDESDDYQPYVPLYEGKPARLIGYTTYGLDKVYLTVDVSAARDPMHVVFHEYVHAVLAENAPLAPLWLHEGLAELYGTLQFDGDDVVFGEAIDYHRELLKKRPLLGDSRFRMLEQSAPEYNEGYRQSAFYAQSWGSVHYLLTAKERRQAFDEFLSRIHHGVKAMVAFHQVLNAHFPDQDTQLREYMSQRKIPSFRLSQEGRSGGDYRKSELSASQSYVVLGELLAHVDINRLDDAQAHLEAALEADPGEVRAHLGLAVVAMQREEFPTGIAELRDARQQDPDDPIVATLLGILLVEEYRRGIDAEFWSLPPETPAELAEARELFANVLEQQPNNALAHWGIGATYMADRDPSPGIESLEVATQLMPWRDEIVVDLVYTLCRADDVVRARTVLETQLKPRLQRGEFGKYEQVVVEAEIARSMQLADQGDITEAALILNRAAKQTTHWKLQRSLATAQEQLKVSDQLDAINRIVDLANEGSIKEALGQLDTLMAGIEDEKLLDFSANLREELEADLEFRQELD